MVELLSEDENLTGESREFVNSIQLSAKALLAIVNDILDFSKIESGRLDIEEVPFNLANTINEVCKLLSMFASQKGLRFVYENSMDEKLELLGDPGRIRQVLSNLLTNALKFTTKGMVKIAVSSESNPADDSVQVTFIVEDTGIGIEKNVLEKLFQPFSQGDASTARLFGGTGLGLTISKNVSFSNNLAKFRLQETDSFQLASLMNGSICLTSTPGVGSKATFIIPLKVSASCTNTSYISQSPPNPGFRYETSPVRAPTWTQRLAHQPTNDDIMHEGLLNQEIGSAVNSSRLGFSRPPSLCDIENLGLSREERAKVHVLVVEDK